MTTPDYLICLDCESPTYVFTWKNGECTEALCEVCGNEQPDQFLSQEEFDAAVGS